MCAQLADEIEVATQDLGAIRRTVQGIQPEEYVLIFRVFRTEFLDGEFLAALAAAKELVEEFLGTSFAVLVAQTLHSLASADLRRYDYRA